MRRERLERAAAQVIAAARKFGVEPHLRLTAAFSDGETLYAIRYATDAYAPTLYVGDTRTTRGRCLVSEPFDREGCDWQAVPPGSFVTVTRDSVTMRVFAPTGNGAETTSFAAAI